MASVTVHCPRCQSAQVYRHGQNPKDRDRFRCHEYHRVFLLTCTYEARKHGVKEQYREDEVDERGVGAGIEGVAYASGGVFGCSGLR